MGRELAIVKTVQAQYITVCEYNVFFSDVTTFLKSHYDVPSYSNTVFILGLYMFKPVSELRRIYPGKRIVIFQLESLTSQNHQLMSTKSILDNIRGADEVWEYDPANSVILNNAGITNKLVPFTYTSALDVGLDKRECDIDLLFYGFLNRRRLNILQPMQTRLYGRRSFVFVFGVHGEELDDYIGRSKIILNMHAFDDQAQEQVRMLRPVCNGKMVLSEHSKHNLFGDAIVEFNSIDSLVQKIDYYLTESRYKYFGIDAREELKRIR